MTELIVLLEAFFESDVSKTKQKKCKKLNSSVQEIAGAAAAVRARVGVRKSGRGGTGGDPRGAEFYEFAERLCHKPATVKSYFEDPSRTSSCDDVCRYGLTPAC